MDTFFYIEKIKLLEEKLNSQQKAMKANSKSFKEDKKVKS